MSLLSRSAGWVVAGVLALGVGGMGVAVAAGTLAPGPGNTYTGCVSKSTGGLRIVSSASQCKSTESVINFPGPQEPQRASVDCTAGQSIQTAVDAAPVNLPLTVDITGTCTENVTIARDNVTLTGPPGPSGAGITAPASTPNALDVQGTGVSLDNLTLTGGFSGLFVGSGATVQAGGLTVTGSSGPAVTVSGGNLNMSGSSIEHNGGGGLEVQFGGVAVLGSVSVTFSGPVGVHLFNGSSVNLGNSSITINGTGLIAQGGSAANIQGTEVENNANDGVESIEGSRVTLQGGSLIENNGGDGVFVQGGSEAALQSGNGGTIISGNGGNGVSVHDVSVAAFSPFGDSNQIVHNGGFGVVCAPAPSVAMITATPGTVSGNGAGQVACPVGS